MTTNYINFPLEIEVLSPLHIGNGKDLSSAGDFFIQQQHIQFVDQQKLAKELHVSGKMNDYLTAILESDDKFHFVEVLKELDVPFEETERFNLNHKNNELIGKKRDLKRCIRTAKQAYIPGSSLKGMLRTVILFFYLKTNRDLLKSIEKELEYFLGNGSKAEIRKFWIKKERELLYEHTYKRDNNYQQLYKNQKEELHNEIFHGIRPEDSKGVDDSDIVIEQINRQHFYAIDNEKGVDYLVECIQPNSILQTALTLLIDHESDDFPFLKRDKPDELFVLINQWSDAMLDLELLLLKKTKVAQEVRSDMEDQIEGLKALIATSDGSKAIARMGKGKTLFFQTLLPLLREDIQQGIIRMYTGKEGDFPQSRILTTEGNTMLGWIQFSYQKPPRNIVDNIVSEPL